MEINKISSTNFQSKIKIVSPKFYDAVVNTMEKDPSYQNIFRWFLSTTPNYPNHFNAYRQNCLNISTEEIRSCSAGFFVNALEKITQLVFHVYDNKDNLEKFTTLRPLFNGSNGLLIGARKQYEHSFPLFEKAVTYAKENNIPVTIMKGFNDMWEANVAYDSSGDEFYLTIKDIQNPKKYIKTEEELNAVFDEFVLSPTDTLEFIA